MVLQLEFKHEPVLLKECIEALNIKPDGIYVDGTLGGAGHSYEIVKKLSDDYDVIKVTSWRECKEVIDNIDEV